MREDVERVLFSEEQIQNRVRELGAQIERDYRDKKLMMVCVLRGAVVFYADLARCVDLPMQMEFIAASSYGSGTVTNGRPNIKRDMLGSPAGRDVLLVEDIVDSGLTLTLLKAYLLEKGAASVKIAALLDKPSGRRPGVELVPDYFGFQVANEFVVGYGLDFDEKYRNLPYVGVLKQDLYKKPE